MIDLLITKIAFTGLYVGFFCLLAAIVGHVVGGESYRWPDYVVPASFIVTFVSLFVLIGTFFIVEVWG